MTILMSPRTDAEQRGGLDRCGQAALEARKLNQDRRHVHDDLGLGKSLAAQL
ncbi:hypothetical protein [Streptomyces sp. NPDC057781]|uniref:hypothetical protein n=1 Tax=unclassified Streptomyces TaxID=2593676 RepID=UPI00369E03D0